MRASEIAIENEVLQLFVDNGMSAGDSLPFRRLRAEWPKTRLRSNDLVQGVKRLVFSGDLELEDDHEGGLFILTPQGQQRAREMPAPVRPSWTQRVSEALQAIVPKSKPRARKERRAPTLHVHQH